MKYFLRAICLVVMILLAGCDSDIVEKLATGQPLTAEETKRYNEQKESFDKAIATKKQEIIDSTYKEATRDEVMAGKRQYKKKNGEVKEFDISEGACGKFGFLAGTQVEITDSNKNKKKANVVGVYENHLWFHLNGVNGATFLSGNNKEELAKNGVALLGETSQAAKESDKTPAAQIKPEVAAVSAAESVKQPVGSTTEYGDVYFLPIPRIPYMKKNN